MNPRLYAAAFGTFFATSVLATVAPSAGAVGEVCQGQRATIVSDGESVTGTPGADVIVLNAVNLPGPGPEVLSGGGDDLVCLTGQHSRVTVALGDGDDSLVVDDTPTARPITVSVDLGVGTDTVVSGRGFDTVVSGDATSSAADGPDNVSTGAGDDNFEAGSRVGEVDLGEGDDRINMVAGDSGRTVRAGSGDDTIAFFNSQIRPTATMDAGPGRDLLEVAGSNAVADLRNERASINGSSFIGLVGVQDIRFDVEYADFVGNELPNLVDVKSCQSRLKGGHGDDIFRASDGIEGSQVIACFEAVTHKWFGNQGDDRLLGPYGRQEFFGGPGDDVMRVGRGFNRLSGGGGDDRVTGGPKEDTIFGGNGNDVLRGKNNDDKLFGGAGRDKAVGGQGRDRCATEIRKRCEG